MAPVIAAVLPFYLRWWRSSDRSILPYIALAFLAAGRFYSHLCYSRKSGAK